MILRFFAFVAFCFNALWLGAQTNTLPVSGNVGIGTIVPSAPLHIRGPGNMNAGTLRLDSDNAFISITSRQHDVANEPEGFTNLSSIYTTNANYLGLGGGLDEFNAATQLHFYTALNASTRTGSVRMTINAAGQVGIGTSSPAALLDVAGNAVFSGTVVFEPTGRKVSIGGSLGSINLHGDGGGWAFGLHAKGSAGTAKGGFGFLGSGDTLDLYYIGDSYSSPSMIVRPAGGNVGIGTTNTSHKLTVNGAIRAKEIIVDSGWADFVFADDFRLASLEEVAEHIRRHKRLPGIPSAAKVTEEGLSMGEMQALMMAKIEELTLYAIEQKRYIENQDRRIEALELENENIRQR